MDRTDCAHFEYKYFEEGDKKIKIPSCKIGKMKGVSGCDEYCEFETDIDCEDILNSTGWWGDYFNYYSSHADMELPVINWSDPHGDPLSDVSAWDTDWYELPYYRFSRVDNNLR